MKTSTLRTAVAALIIGAIAFSSTARPAQANTTSTILITAAAVAALATGINVAEKNARANSVVGYLRNGSVVFADGHVVAPNGQSWYPGNAGESIACNGQYCSIVQGDYNNYGYINYGSSYPAFVSTYNNYTPAYISEYPAGYSAPGYYSQPYQGGSGYYGGSTRVVNTYVNNTTIVRHVTPVRHDPVVVVHHDPIVVVHHDPIVVREPVRHDPRPVRTEHPDTVQPIR
jgi:hypothetical protein